MKTPCVPALAILLIAFGPIRAELADVRSYGTVNLGLLLRGGSALASSCTPKWEPEKAYDGNAGHFAAWYPDWWGAQPDKPHPWLQRDLGEARLIGRVVTRTVLSPDRCSFKIELSEDGQLWTASAVRRNVSDEVVVTFPAVRARFVRTTFLHATSAPVVYEQLIYEVVAGRDAAGRTAAVRLVPPKPSLMERSFPLGIFWAPDPWPMSSAQFRAAARRDFPLIRDLGANAVTLGPFTPNSAEKPFAEYIALLDEAQRHGLKLLLPVWVFNVLASRSEGVSLDDVYPAVRDTVRAVGKHPALLGYYLFDEPLPWYASNLRTLDKVLASLDPKHPAVAIFTGPAQMRTVFPQAGLRVNMLDVYPLTKGSPVGEIRYENAFLRGDRVEFGELMRRLRSLAPDRPAWLVAQAFSEGGWRMPEPGELTRMCNLAVDNGFTGIWLFVYNTKASGAQVGLVDAEGRPTRLYDESKRLFADLKRRAARCH